MNCSPVWTLTSAVRKNEPRRKSLQEEAVTYSVAGVVFLPATAYSFLNNLLRSGFQSRDVHVKREKRRKAPARKAELSKTAMVMESKLAEKRRIGEEAVAEKQEKALLQIEEWTQRESEWLRARLEKECNRQVAQMEQELKDRFDKR